MTDEEIDDKIEEWHQTSSYKELSLHEFLGWTWQQYKNWVEKGVKP